MIQTESAQRIMRAGTWSPTRAYWGSPPNAVDLQKANAEHIQRIERGKPLTTPERKYIPRLTKSVEHLRARLSIAENKIAQMETVIAGRKK